MRSQSNLKFCLLVCCFYLLNYSLNGQDKDTTLRHQIGFSTSFSNAALSNNLEGKALFNQQSFDFYSKKTSLGAGNNYQLFYLYNLDSSDFFISTEIGVLVGKKNMLTSPESNSTIQTGMSIDTRMWHFAAMIGYKIKLPKQLSLSFSTGILAPFYNKLTENFTYTDQSYQANITKTYYTRFFPGFIGNAALNYTYNKSLSFSIFSRLTLLTLQEKRSKISSFSSTENEQITTYYPNISDQETTYYKDLSSLKNDPLITPNNFDSNKPQGALSKNLPYSNIAFGIKFLWSF